MSKADTLSLAPWIFIEGSADLRPHGFRGPTDVAVHRHPVRLEEVWGQYEAIPREVPADLVNDGDVSALTVPPGLVSFHVVPLAPLGASAITFVGPALLDIRQVIPASHGVFEVEIKLHVWSQRFWFESLLYLWFLT